MKTAMIALLLLTSLTATAYEPPAQSWGYSRPTQARLQSGRLALQADMAVDSVVRFAIYELRMRGHRQEANTLRNEWRVKKAQLALHRTDEALGDHRPLSQWLAEKYFILEMILGTKVMEMTRLVDIKTINFALPVIFGAVEGIDAPEYSLHFVPFVSVTAYWTSLISCSSVTMGAWVLVCGPVAYGAEWVTARYVAPAFSNVFYDIFY